MSTAYSRSFLATTAVCLLGATSIASCSTASSQSGSTSLSLVASTTQICDYVTQIAQQPSAQNSISLDKTDATGTQTHIGAPAEQASAKVQLTCLLAPNASAHEHEMTPQQLQALASAKVLLVSGVDLEHFLDQAVSASGFKGTMGVTSGVLSARDIEDPQNRPQRDKLLPYSVSRGSHTVEAAPWPFPPEEGESEPEFAYDPHVWTSPANAALQVRNIGEFLSAADPDHAEAYSTATEEYAKRIDSLDAWAKDSFNSVPTDKRVLFSSHDAFGYLSKRYGIRFIGAALSDFNEQQDATAEHIAQASEEVKKSGASAIFAENSNNSKSIETIARAAGVKAIIGDDALYGDSLGPVGSEGETYIGSIIHNVTTMTKAWDGTIAPLPSELKR